MSVQYKAAGSAETPDGTPREAKRQASNANITRNADGSVSLERKAQSIAEVAEVAVRRMSSSSHASLAAVLGVQAAAPTTNAMEMIEKPKEQADFIEHLWDLDALAANYYLHIDSKNADKSRGLTKEKAEEIFEEVGPNVLTPPPKLPLWLLFLLQFTNLLMVLLEIVAVCCFALFGANPSQWSLLYVAVLLCVCIFVTCYETFSQEAKADSLMEKFRAMIPAQAAVIRDGEQNPVEASHIVPGDIIRIKSGDKIPADCRVIYAQGMKVDQSMITGESEPVDVSVVAKNQNALEAKNIIFNGSLCVEGMCLAVAIRTGDHTFIGKMVELTGDAGGSASTLQADIVYFVRVLTIFALVQAAIVFIVGCAAIGLSPLSVFVNGFIVIMIGNIPQGLPSTITACLFIVADRMGKKNVFVKKLDIIETLGSCNVVCTDKTGTLTMNLMSVANWWVFNSKMNFKEAFATSERGAITPQFMALMEIATLNSRVVIEVDQKDGSSKPNGDATELGLYRFFTKMMPQDITIQDYRTKRYPKMHEIPFNSKNKWQMSIHEMGGGKQRMFVKGAPDVLLSKCSHYLAADGSIRPKDAEFNTIYDAVYDAFGGNGERVLGFARHEMERSLAEEEARDPNFKDKLKERLIGASEADAIRNLVFVGLVTLQDPPREEVPKAVRDCQEAGVRVVMVTGDHPVTAEAIARQIGLITKSTRSMVAKKRGVPVEAVRKDDPEVEAVVVRGVEISGSSLENITPMTDDDWKVLISKPEIVFARTSPENKLTIVKQFTAAGNVTAMTGDGVNDSPALKQAAIGVAMGLNGSDVAKEAGDIILLDDNFASIVVGIREGRLLFANLKKSVAYSLAHLVPEVVPVLIWSFSGCPQPMGTLLALCVDLLTELVPASSLAYEKAEGIIMKVPPRDLVKEKLTSFQLLFYSYAQSGMILTGGCYFVFFRAFQFYGVSASDLFTKVKGNYFPASDGQTWHCTDGTHRDYSPRQQKHILAVIYGAWYLMIVVGQALHIMPCRTTTMSIFQHGVFSNSVTNMGIIIALWLGCFCVYVPRLQEVEQADFPFSAEIFYASLFVGWALWSWSEGRKWFTRNYPDNCLNKYLAW